MGKQKYTLERRRFLWTLFQGTLFSSVAPMLIACGDSPGSAAGGGSDGSCSTGAAVTYTNPGHGHTEVNLTATEVTNATPGVYTLLGGGHTHTFNLSAANFVTLQGGGTVTVTDIEGHGHSIDITC